MTRKYALLTFERYATLTEAEAALFDVITDITVSIDFQTGDEITARNGQTVSKVTQSIAGKQVEYLIDGTEPQVEEILLEGITAYETKPGNTALPAWAKEKVCDMVPEIIKS